MPALLGNEIKRSLVPNMAAQYEELRQKLFHDLFQKLQKNDDIFREHMKKVCSNQVSKFENIIIQLLQGFHFQNLMDQFGKSITTSVRSMFENSYRESMNNNVVPSFERATKEMFKQLQNTYLLGVKEMTKSIEQYMTQYSVAEDRQNEIINSIKILPDQIKSSSDKMIKASTSEIIQDVSKDFKLMQANLTKNLKEHIRNEVLILIFNFISVIVY